jgi:DNA polymerase V
MSGKKLSYDESIESMGALEAGLNLERPLLGAEISAGFPSPAQDYIETNLDLNRQLILHEASTFFVKVAGDSMIEAGIYEGDILIVDRALPARDKKIVIAALEGELTVKQLHIEQGRWYLLPQNQAYQAIEIGEDNDFAIWGVVTYAIHKLF